MRAAGADVVGMSTIPEVLAAREMGVEVAVLSLVTNAVVIPERYRSVREEVEAEVCMNWFPQQPLVDIFLSLQLAGRVEEREPDGVVSHEEVLLIGREKADVMRRLVEKVVELVPP